MGGRTPLDPAVIGFPGASVIWNDVWTSDDLGVSWQPALPPGDFGQFPARAYFQAVTKGRSMYVLGGEFGFLCAPEPCELPYFNDVWRSRDGVNWELVTPHAAWSARPGHQAVVLQDHIVLLGGFGLPFNPSDMWASRNGRDWALVSDAPWNAMSSDDIKYDFDALAVQGGPGGMRPSLFTFGGDRETFNFGDPLNFLRVDNDVWRWSPSKEVHK